MRYPKGKFEDSSSICVGYLKSGDCGYVSLDDIRLEGRRLCIGKSELVYRRHPGHIVYLWLQVTKKGYALQLLGHDRFREVPEDNEEPESETIIIAQIEMDGKIYTEWDDELLYRSLKNLSSGAIAYVDAVDVNLDRREAWCRASAEIFEECEPGMLPVRRLTVAHFEVEATPGRWIPLRIGRK
jgi:hypothetical protein